MPGLQSSALRTECSFEMRYVVSQDSEIILQLSMAELAVFEGYYTYTSASTQNIHTQEYRQNIMRQKCHERLLRAGD